MSVTVVVLIPEGEFDDSVEVYASHLKRSDMVENHVIKKFIDLRGNIHPIKRETGSRCEGVDGLIIHSATVDLAEDDYAAWIFIP